MRTDGKLKPTAPGEKLARVERQEKIAATPGFQRQPTTWIGRMRGASGRRFSLTPINRRRWESFKANRRGYWSFWIFLVLFVLSLGAEVISNDKPLLVRYKGEFLSPVLVDYPESKFGGFLAVTDYKDPFIIEEIGQNGWMIWPPIRHSYTSINKDYPRIKGPEDRCLGFPAPPPWATSAELCEAPPDQLARFQELGNRNWLGTDDQGRDVLARMIYGFRISVLFGLVLTFFSSIIGVTAGAVQGYFGGRVDLFFQRVLEIWSSIPSLYVLIIISSVLVPGFWTLLGVLLLFQWVSLVGVVRAEFLRARNFEYVTAARALGLSDRKIMLKHLLPNAMVATLTFLPFNLSGSITALTALDFLGLGLPPGSASLGELLAQGKANLQAPWLGLAAFFSLATLLSLLIFIGEAVRDALDPRKTFR
ncbi:MAG: ABC transporter permease [Hyphomicrobiaceae bacterium]|nr:ABC transporter permease [Hyphomicrobiaceae bacterium]